MEDIQVEVYPDGKTVKAFRYAPTVILVMKGTVYDTDESIVTDANGYRHKRHLYAGETEWSVFSEYRRI